MGCVRVGGVWAVAMCCESGVQLTDNTKCKKLLAIFQQRNIILFQPQFFFRCQQYMSPSFNRNRNAFLSRNYSPYETTFFHKVSDHARKTHTSTRSSLTRVQISKKPWKLLGNFFIFFRYHKIRPLVCTACDVDRRRLILGQVMSNKALLRERIMGTMAARRVCVL